MRKIVALSIVALSSLSVSEAQAQPAKKTTPAAQSTVEKSAALYGGAAIKSADVDFDGDLRFSVKGNIVLSGTFDACVSTDSSSTVSDRFKVPLNIKGNEITGTGTTDIGKQPVTLSLKKTGNSETITLSGQIIVGGVPIDIKTDDIDLQKVEPNDETPDDQLTVSVPSFNAITIKTPLQKAVEVLGILRSEQTVIGSAGLIPSCADLRNGYTQLEITINPSRTAGVIGKLNQISGVEGKMVDIVEPNMTIKIPKDKQGSRRDDDLVASISKAIVTATGGKSDGTPTLDSKTGEYEAKVQRESILSKRLGLSEGLSTKFLIGHDPKTQDTFVIISGMTSELIDNTPTQKLIMSEGANVSEEGGGNTSGVNTTYLDGLVLKNVAKELNGQMWDNDGGKWKEK